MVQVRVTYTFSDGGELEAECYLEESFPDAADQARGVAMRAFREAFATCAVEPAAGEAE